MTRGAAAGSSPCETGHSQTTRADALVVMNLLPDLVGGGTLVSWFSAARTGGVMSDPAEEGRAQLDHPTPRDGVIQRQVALACWARPVKTQGLRGALSPRSAGGKPWVNRNVAFVQYQRTDLPMQALTGLVNVTTTGTV